MVFIPSVSTIQFLPKNSSYSFSSKKIAKVSPRGSGSELGSPLTRDSRKLMKTL